MPKFEPKLSKKDWEELKRNNLAFVKWPEKHFRLLLKVVFHNPGSGNPSNPDPVTQLMMCLSHSEPPIPPVK